MTFWSKILLTVFLLSLLSGYEHIFVATKNVTRREYEYALPCDVVFLMDDSKNVTDSGFEDAASKLSPMDSFFALGKQKSQVAVVLYSNSSRIKINLTSDPNAFKNFTPVRERGGALTDKALVFAKEHVLDRGRPEAIKNIILITGGDSIKYTPHGPNPWESNWNETEEVAMNLRKHHGVHISVAYHGEDTPKEKYLNITGEKDLIASLEILSRVTMPITRRCISVTTCEFEFWCNFDAKQTCIPTFVPHTDYPCSVVEPDLPGCSKEKCEEVCDLWQWAVPNCTGLPDGHSVIVEHRLPAPEYPPRVFDHCPKNKTITCPYDPSTTTSITTPSNTTTTKTTTSTTTTSTTTTTTTLTQGSTPFPHTCERWCWYYDDGKCKPVSNPACISGTPPPTYVCHLTDCEATCDAAWNWTVPDCDGIRKGEQVTVKREGPQPDSNLGPYQHCPLTKQVVCPGTEICKVEINCYYNNRSRCEPLSVPPGYASNCPPPCPEEKCAKPCDEFWPWEEPDCAGVDGGQELIVWRNGTIPPYGFLTKCPKFKKVACPDRGCETIQVCSFKISQECDPVIFPPENASCPTETPPAKVCRKEDCEQACDELWKWQKPNCTVVAVGQEVTVKRWGPPPEGPPGLYTRCPITKKVKCQIL